MQSLGRFLILGGIALVLVGAGLLLAARLGLRIGHLPGDIRIDREGSSFYFPVTTSILISVILTLALNAILWIIRK